MGKKRRGLCLQTQLMEIEQTFHWVGPEGAVGCTFKENHRLVEDMDDEAGGLVSFRRTKRRIKLPEETEIGLPSPALDGEVETRSAHEIERWEKPLRARHAADGHARWLHALEPREDCV